jgi:outer membrane receptor protein involved in Fe transport
MVATSHALADEPSVLAAPADSAPSDPPPPRSTSSPGAAESPKKTSAPAKVSNIEDAALEGLMGLNLEDKLGQTEAVSRANESVLRAPATMTTLDALQIRLSGATNVPDLLRVVPGVVVYRTAPGSYVVSLRGTGGIAANNLILLVDGIPINSPVDGTVSWDLVPVAIEDIERVEVVRGPVSPTYGANAYTGVINIVTRSTIGRSPSYAARVRGGFDERGGGAGAVSGRFLHVDKNIEFKWFLNTERDGMNREPSAFRGTTLPDHPPGDRASLLSSLAYKASATSKVSLEVGQSWTRRSGLDHLVLDTHRQSQNLLFGRAAYEFTDPSQTFGNFKVWAQGQSLSIRAPEEAKAGFSYDGTTALRGSMGADTVVALHKSVSLLAGAQYSLETIRAAYLHPNADGRVQPTYGFYGGVKASPMPSLDVVVSGRGDLAPISAKMAYSYRASAIYYRDTWSLRLTGASAFRYPTYVEAVGRFVDPTSRLILLEGTSSLESPRNTSVELGGNFALVDTLTISPTIYLSRLSNLMVEDFESVVRRTFRNDATTRTFAGGELEASWRLNDSMTLYPSLTVLHWLDGAEQSDSNVGVPAQNSKYIGGLRLQGLFGNERWGYGIAGTIASPRTYNLRTGIPPVVLSQEIPTTARILAMIEREIAHSPAIWASLRLATSLPSDRTDSPIPHSAPLGQSAIVAVEMRRE